MEYPLAQKGGTESLVRVLLVETENVDELAAAIVGMISGEAFRLGCAAAARPSSLDKEMTGAKNGQPLFGIV